MKLHRIFSLFFHLLYHPFAWGYDAVAALVSLGQWRTWVQAVLPMIESGDVLEIGFGPGHLQVAFAKRGLRVFGLDESPQMIRLAARRLALASAPACLTRGLAQNLPFTSNAFRTVVATFPAPYIFDPRSAGEIARVLAADGRLVVLLGAWITGRSLPARLMAWLFHVTGQSPQNVPLDARVQAIYQSAGLRVREVRLDAPGAALLVLLAEHQ